MAEESATRDKAGIWDWIVRTLRKVLRKSRSCNPSRPATRVLQRGQWDLEIDGDRGGLIESGIKVLDCICHPFYVLDSQATARIRLTADLHLSAIRLDALDGRFHELPLLFEGHHPVKYIEDLREGSDDAGFRWQHHDR